MLEYICRYYGVFVDFLIVIIFIVMEFCEGGLFDFIYKEVKCFGGCIGEKVFGKIFEGVF